MSAPYSWVKKLTSLARESEIIPLFGKAPPFDWKKLSELIQTEFKLSDLQIRPKTQAMNSASELYQGFGDKLLTFAVNIAPVGRVFWVVSEADMSKLSLSLMDQNGPPPSEVLQEGFYRYLLLESLHKIGMVSPLDAFTLKLEEENEERIDEAFCIDIEIQANKITTHGRLLIPHDLRKKWVQHFSIDELEYIPSETASKITLRLGVQTGSVLLHQTDLKTLKPGDFVLLDKGSYNAHKQSGVCMLMLETTPLFSAKIKSNKIELINYAFYYEDNMEETPLPENPEMTPLEEETKQEALPESEGETVAIKELPVHLTIELARIKISLEKLMQLTPGNVLELPIHPDQGVNLTVNGEKIGKAELVYLGEQLGIRILEI